MKKKYIVMVLLIVGIVLLSASVCLAVIFTLSKDIIAGADIPSLTFAFFRENGGICFAFALLGIVAIVVSAVLAVTKKMSAK